MSVDNRGLISARREIGKWLTGQPNRDVDKVALAELCHEHDLMLEALDLCEMAITEWDNEGLAQRAKLAIFKVRTLMPNVELTGGVSRRLG